MSQPNSSASAGNFQWNAGAVAAVAVLAVLVHLAVPLPSDVSWLIVVNERLVDGQRLYADILETNPPMASWLYALPVALERLTGLAAESWTILETIVAGLLALWLGERILGQADRPLPFWLAAAILLLLPVDSFAQREHFILFGLLPALALAIRRIDGTTPPRGSALAAGLGMALMLALKPYFLIPLALLAVAIALKRRSIRALLLPEHWVAIVLLLGYELILATAYPAFLSDVLPAAGRLYLPLHMDMVALLLQPHALLVYGAVIAALLGWRGGGGLRVAPLIALIGCFIVYAVQAKGWAYHLLPGDALAAMILFSLALAARPRLVWLAVIAAVTALPGIVAIVVALARPEPLLEPLRADGPGARLLVISSDIGLGNPLSRQLGDRLVNSSPMLWRATGAMLLTRNAGPAEQAEFAADIDRDHRLLADDLARTEPDIVLADTGGFDWLGWAMQDPATATLLRRYAIGPAIATHGTIVTVLRRQ